MTPIRTTTTTATLQISGSVQENVDTKSAIKNCEERAVGFKVPRSVKPATDLPADNKKITRPNDDILHIIPLPEKGLMGTVFEENYGQRIFVLEGDIASMQVSENALGDCSRGMAALGEDLIVAGSNEGAIATWRGSTCERLETTQVGTDSDFVTAMAAVSDEKFVAGTSTGALIFLSHTNGRNLREFARGKSMHFDWINDLAVRGQIVVTASADKTAAVWSARTQEKLGVLCGHVGIVSCAAASDNFIATGGADETIRVYENGETYPLFRVLEGVHSNWVWQAAFVREDLLMSSSADGTVAFTSLYDGKPVARVDAGMPMMSVALTSPYGRPARVGMNCEAAILPPSAFRSADFKKKLSAAKIPGLSIAGNGSANQPRKKQRLAIGDGESFLQRLEESYFDLSELKVEASDPERVQELNNEDLSKTTAAVMINFEEAYRSRLPALAGCLATVFENLCIGGDLFVGLPETTLYDMIVDGLKRDDVYARYGVNVTIGFEWRLKRLIKRLRM